MDRHKYRAAFRALFLAAAASAFCSCQSSTAVPAKQPETPAVKSLFADANQMAMSTAGPNPSYAGQRVYDYRAAIKSNGAETLLILVFFKTESPSAAADAAENAKRIISSVSGG